MPFEVFEAAFNKLPAEKQKEAYDFICFLASTSPKDTLNNIQNIFKNNKGWESEEEMLSDMANFRKERLSQCVYSQ